MTAHRKTAIACLTTLLTCLPGALAAQDTAIERLQPEDRAAGDLFACALSLSGGTLLAGSLLDDDRGPDSGSAYVFDLGAAGWAQSAKLLGTDTRAGDRFGFSVELDGDRALIGAPLSGPGGAAYRFERVNGAWRQTARFAATETGADAGSAVAFLGEGAFSFALVGAPRADAGGRVDAGAVLVYLLQGGLEGRLEAPTPRSRAGFGWKVAASGELAAVGAPWADAPLTGSGEVVLFSADIEGFHTLGEVTAPDAAPFEAFGYSVGLAGNLLVVGAPRDGQNGPSAGAVYLFRLQGGQAVLETKIPGATPGDRFGISVDVAADGRSFAVGADGGNGSSGYVDVFERSGNLWVIQRHIQPAAASIGDGVGIDVSLSGRGAAVGAYKDDGGGVDAGAAYVVLPAADLALTKRVESPAAGERPPAPGEEAVFAVEVANLGPADAMGARVLDAPPEGLLGAAWTCTAEGGARCTAAGDGAIDDRVDLPAGSRVTYRVSGVVAQGVAGELVNSASVAPPAGLLDPDPDNGADQAAVAVGAPRADLYFDVRFVSGAPATRGSAVAYEVEIGNLGPSDAPPIPFAGGGLGPAFVAPSWTCSPEGGATCTPAQGTGAIAGTIVLPVGSRVIYRLEATVGPSTAGALVLAGSLGPLTGLDPDPSNNSDTVVVPLGGPLADVAVRLAAAEPVPAPVTGPSARHGGLASRAEPVDGPVPLRPGEEAELAARISNAGPSDALGVRVQASLPPGVAGRRWTCTAPEGVPGASPSEGAGPLDARLDLPVGSGADCFFRVSGLEGFLGSDAIEVSVTSTGAFEDPDLSDNRDRASGPILLPDRALAATLEARGTFAEGDVMSYELRVASSLEADLPDAPGDEVTLPVPPQLVVQEVTADAGEASLVSPPGAPARVVWNGELRAMAVVTIRIRARILNGTRGESVEAQAILGSSSVDPQSRLRSSPPGALEPAPTIFVVRGFLEIPTVSEWGLALLALLLGASALARLRQRRTA